MNTDQQNPITLLNTQKQLLDQLLFLLRQEISALASRDIEQLDILSKQKLAILSQLEQTDKKLSALPDLPSLKQQDWFTSNVTELEQLLAECKSQNDINQKTLEQSQLTLERFKNELLAARGKSGLTYTNKGKPSLDSIGKGIKA